MKSDPMPHPTRALVNATPDRLSRIVHTAGVAVKGLAVRDTLPCQPARKDTCHVRMNGGGPVLPLLFVVINSLLHPPAPSPHTLPHFRTSPPLVAGVN